MQKQTLASALILTLLALGSVTAQEATSTWTRLTDELWEQIPDYEDGNNHFVRRSGSLLVNPRNGHLFLLAAPAYGVWTSTDHGETWSRSDDNVISGRSWGRDGCTFDVENPERMAFFTIVGAGHQPVGGLSLDGGKTWKAIQRPSEGHDGWTSAQVDWTREDASRIYGKEHHTSNLWVTESTGETWEKAMPEKGSYMLGLVGDALLAATGERNSGQTILRSGDGGASWQPVSETVNLQMRRPAVSGDKAYWAAPNALMISQDAGKTWAKSAPIVGGLGDADTPRTWGPVFGRTDQEMLVAVADHGFFGSADAGQTWRKLADWPQNLTEFDRPRGAFSLGWSPGEDLVYCAFLGGEAYRAPFIKKE